MGGVVRARAMAKQLGDADMAIIDKRRAKANESEVMHIIGDVKDRDCVIIDDMVDTAGTLCKAAAALKERGARRVVGYITHPVLSGKAIQTIAASVLDELVVTDTIPLSDAAKHGQNSPSDHCTYAGWSATSYQQWRIIECDVWHYVGNFRQC